MSLCRTYLRHRSFSLRIPLERPFLYDPLKGDLLLEFRVRSPFRIGQVDAVANSNMALALGALESAQVPEPSVGGFGKGGYVTEFQIQSLPEPSISFLFILGITVLVTIAKLKSHRV